MRLQHCSIAHGDHGDGRCAWDGARLPPGRRRWCSEACAQRWRENHVWSAARPAALERAAGCELCHDPEDLEVHHDPPVGERGYGHGCQHHQENLHVLCVPHHREADMARRHAARGEAVQLSLIAA